MDNFDDDLSQKQKEFVESLEKASNKDSFEQKNEFKEETVEVFHLNSLITKNIYLFTKDPNYKLFTWLMVQLFIFSLFVLVATFMKNNLVPYINSL
jgi:hypothetical protein